MTSEEDDLSNANTDDSLIQSSSRTSSEELEERRRSKCCCGGSICYLITSLILLLWAITTLVWPPFELSMSERLRMMPGLPPYEFWKNPPDQVLVRIYIFNITNSEEFLSQPNTVKLNVAEIGPLVFMEKLTHTNVTFNENGTMSYVATRKAIFLPDKNFLDLNSTIIVPNWALLGVASYLSDQSFFVKFGFNLLTRTIKPQPFVKLTIDQFLWNFTDPMLDAAQKIAPLMIPIRNLGILSRIYTHFENTVTVLIGSQNGHKNFFLIDKYDGSEYLPNYGPNCNDRVSGSTEGVTYPQFLTKNDSLIYWRKTLCKNAILNYDSEETKYGVRGYRYTLPKSTFDRTEPIKNDCYKSDPVLMDGLSDVSKCHFGFPLASSFPHFLYSKDEGLRNNISGLNANESLHGSFVIVEPMTGVPLESRARSQSNLVVRQLNGFNEIVSQFSNMVIPMFWMEYNQVGLPWYIAGLVFFQVNILPIFQRFLTSFLLATSVLLTLIVYRRKRKNCKHFNDNVLVSNKVLIFEKELFLKNKS